jgi:arginase
MAIGSVSGLKSVHPNSKLIWMDAHMDANTPETSPSGNVHGMPLAYLMGVVPFHRHWKCVDMAQDVCYFGVRSYEADELQMIREKGTLVFEPEACRFKNIDKIHRLMNHHFANGETHPNYWVSFDIDSLDQSQFASTGTAEGNGLTIEFCHKLFQKFLPRSHGMDFTEVNFDLAQSFN